MRSQARRVNAGRFEQQVFLAYAPDGVSFSIGYYRATIITGVDVLPDVTSMKAAGPTPRASSAMASLPNSAFTYAVAARFHGASSRA